MASDQPSIAKLEEVAVVNPRRKVKKGEAVPFIEMAALPTNGRDISVFDLQTRLAKGAGSHFENGDTLLARITPCLENGKTAQVKSLESGVIGEGSTEFIVLCGQDSEDDDFIYYLTRSVDFRDFAIARMEGTSGRQRVAWQSIASYEFTLPSPRIRREAASFLATLDDRIDNLRQTNATLEAIAQSLFKSWFVDFDPVRAKAEGREPEGMDAATAALFPSEFGDSELGPIPKGWRVVSLEDEVTVERGLSYKGAGLATAEQGLPMHNLNSVLEGGGYKYSGIKYYAGAYKERHLAQAGDILVANTEQGHHHRLIGFPAIVPERYTASLFSHHLYRVTPKATSGLHREWLYRSLMIPAVRDQVIGCANGSTVNMLKAIGLQVPRFVAPPAEVVTSFVNVAEPLRRQSEGNVERVELLGSLRDTLLPRLISGKLRLPDAEAQVGVLA